MAENSNGQERTEEATPRRLQKAREEGQTARSRELVTMALVGGGALGLLSWFPRGSEVLLDFGRSLFTRAGNRVLATPETLQQVLSDAMWIGAMAVGPLLLLLVFISIAASGALGGFLFSSKAMMFKAERISPLKGFKRMFSTQSVVELFKSIAKFCLISGTAIVFIWQSLSLLFSLGGNGVAGAATDGLELVGGALFLFALVLGLIAAVDVPFQISTHKKQLRMTKQEVKDEMRDSEGKPEVKSAIRRAQQAIANRRMLEEVPSADVVITNPEHFAVALRYEAGSVAPLVVARGADHMALRIREVASANKVPMLRLPPLARAIYFHCNLGNEIPAPLYAAVAQVLAYIQQLREFRRLHQGTRPTLGPVNIPRDMQRQADGGGE
ncbi:MAG: flagellar biosynthesis protein FlhB [Pseudomonadales bacterium]